jgi:hypothetical protein
MLPKVAGDQTLFLKPQHRIPDRGDRLPDRLGHLLIGGGAAFFVHDPDSGEDSLVDVLSSSYPGSNHASNTNFENRKILGFLESF